jgi:hypothetical protein
MHLKVSDVLRHALLLSGRNPYQIAADVGVDQAAIRRFVNMNVLSNKKTNRGHKGIRMETFDELCTYLGLKLVKADGSDPAAPVRAEGYLDWSERQVLEKVRRLPLTYD